MLRISIAELRPAYKEASADLNGRELVIDVKGLTTISEDGEDVLPRADERRS